MRAISVETIARGRYRVEDTLGHGGMAVVYLARDAELGRPVALKLLAENLTDDGDFRRRFVREARLAARLSHPNVVQVYDAGEDDGRPFIVMEYVLSEEAARATFDLTSAPVVLVGHSHVALALALADGRITGGVAAGGAEEELAERRLLNPGSVGQPRDGDPRAAWLLLDLDRRFAAFRRVPYPFERTQAEMHEAGLPRALADRLARGE